jgi:hypothetical protein
MISTIRSHLGIKLFLSYLLVILAGVLILGLASTLTVPQAFNQHMRGMQMPSGTGFVPGQGMMQGNGPRSGKNI